MNLKYRIAELKTASNIMFTVRFAHPNAFGTS